MYSLLHHFLSVVLAVQSFQISNTYAQQLPSTEYNPFFFPQNCNPRAAFRGYGINHFGLTVTDLDKSIDFYEKVLGLSLLFIYKPVENGPFSVAYIGHNEGLKNSTPFTSCQEFTTQKSHIRGLIEFVHLKNATYTPLASTVVPNTFSHIGAVVPNITETNRQLLALNATILKPYGELPSTDSPMANAYGLGPRSTKNLSRADKEAISKGMELAGFRHVIAFADPDGNVIEVEEVTAL